MNQLVEILFPISGTSVVRDHGYLLYGALCHVIPLLHEAPWLAVHPLSGAVASDEHLTLKPSATLTLRMPAERIPAVLPLAGVTLDIAGARLSLGAPRVQALVPAASLDARLVVLKLTNAPHKQSESLGRETLDNDAIAQRYAVELTRQLAKLEIASLPQLLGRQSITVVGKRIVGYSVRVGGLNADQSLRLQQYGLGGKHRMGCGVFRPTRGT